MPECVLKTHITKLKEFLSDNADKLRVELLPEPKGDCIAIPSEANWFVVTLGSSITGDLLEQAIKALDTV